MIHMTIIPPVSKDIPMDKIVLGSSQARQRSTKVDRDDDLVHSIRKHGLISPVLVRRTEGGRYKLLIGQRRFRAHEMLNMSTIRAHVVDQHTSERDAKLLSMIENVARKDMKRADLIDAAQFLVDKCNSTSAVAEEIGLSTSTIRKYANIARLPEAIRADISNKLYTADHALKALQALGDDESAVDISMLREISSEMKKLSPQGKKKLIEVKKNEPGLPIGAAVEKAKRRTETHKIDLEVTDDQLERIGKYKKREEITNNEDATSELLDLGLNAADV